MDRESKKERDRKREIITKRVYITQGSILPRVSLQKS